MHELALPRNRTLRVAGVTAGLSVAGATAGAGLGVALAMVAGGFIGSPSAGQMLLSAALVGAAHGAVFLPVAAWALLRKVPIGRAFLWTSMATAWGAASGFALLGLNPSGGVLGGVLGFALSTWSLRRSTRT